jgi:hypothetical protein
MMDNSYSPPPTLIFQSVKDGSSWEPNKQSAFSLVGVLVISIFYGLFFMPYILLRLFFIHGKVTEVELGMVVVELFSLALGLVMLIVTSYLLLLENPLSEVKKFAIGFCLCQLMCNCLMLFIGMWDRGCSYGEWLCHDNFAQSTILLIPLLPAIAFPYLGDNFHWTMWGICVLSKTIVTCLMGQFADLVTIIACSLITAFVLYTLLTCNSLKNMIETQKQAVTRAAAEINEVEIQVKHIVANVAHDLKTVRRIPNSTIQQI